MLQYAITFLVIALLAAFLGFGGLAAFSMEAARLIFGVFLVLFIVTAVLHMRGGKTPKL